MYYPLTHAKGLLQGLYYWNPNSPQTLAYTFEQRAARDPERTFLLYEDRRISYGEANRAVNRHAHAYRALGIGKNDVVALMLDNRPEFLWHLLGLHKLGAIVSLINTQLSGDSLVHALEICQPRRITVGTEVGERFAQVRQRLHRISDACIDGDVDMGGDGAPLHSGFAQAWASRLEGQPDTNPSETGKQRLADQAAYIYTSGTTGLPKAAVVRHHRFYRAGRVWAGLAFAFRSRDVLYNCLPLYHANSALLATGSVITAGVTMALARKFSRSRFWDDVRRYDATSFIYIGELCRYLLHCEPSPRDRDHRIRAISGNGLRPDIWRRFQRRFGVRRIVEFYGATEGNCITLNALGLPGAVGPMLPGMVLARWDETKNDFVRDGRGRLTRPRLGEPGVLLGRVRPRASFDGYRDTDASERKLVRNAFALGDSWFNTGDLLRLDPLWHLHFVDRLGDTYRWKGENVATLEVQEQLSTWQPVQEVNVYGVPVPGSEGKAGMAALVLKPGIHFDPAGLREHVEARLPSFARPRFVRITQELGTTSTLKLKKTDLQKEGYDPRRVHDPLYLLHPEKGQYVELTPELFDSLAAERLQL